MTQDEIIKTVNNFLVEEFEVDEAKITPDANLRETLELDSLDYVDLVVIHPCVKLLESRHGYEKKNSIKRRCTF